MYILFHSDWSEEENGYKNRWESQASTDVGDKDEKVLDSAIQLGTSMFKNEGMELLQVVSNQHDILYSQRRVDGKIIVQKK